MVSLVASHGVEYLFATVVLMGILQVLAQEHIKGQRVV